MAKGISRERIVDTALTLLDEQGIEGVTARALAQRLGVQAPALYWHVASKSEIIDEMGTAVSRRVVAAMAAAEVPDGWRDGASAPWPVPAPPLSVAEVVAAVAAQDLPVDLAPDFEDARPSAVLAVLADGPEGAEVLLTRRSWQLSSHKGEVSFPGGRLDPGDQPQEGLRGSHCRPRQFDHRPQPDG